MTIDEARAHVGDGVLYHPRCGHTEEGVITRVSGTWVFVKYEALATMRDQGMFDVPEWTP